MLLFSGCAGLNGMDNDYGNVRGSWKYKDPAANPVTLTFNKNNTYELDYNNDGVKDIWGEYKISNNWIILKDVGGDFALDCGYEGAYKFKIKGDTVDFSVLGDQCLYRAQALAISWQKTSRIKRIK